MDSSDDHCSMMVPLRTDRIKPIGMSNFWFKRRPNNQQTPENVPMLSEDTTNDSKCRHTVLNTLFIVTPSETL